MTSVAFLAIMVSFVPVFVIIVFIFSRANENGGMLGKVALEKNMLGKELFRRISRGQIFYKPKGQYKPIGFN